MNDNRLIRDNSEATRLDRQVEPKSTILDKAKAAVYGDRERDYGPVRADMECIAKMWSAILGKPIAPEQIPLCMVALKLSRLTYAMKEDSIVDVAGWAAVLERYLKESK